MAVSGFSLLLAAVSALAALAALAFPVRAADSPAVPVIAAAPRIAEVPREELSDRLRPAEVPPPDFTAAQYIDSAGCVFIRAEGGWLGRIARDGTPICGYPPTLSVRRTGPDNAAALFQRPEEPPAERIRRELTEAIIPNLQAGELVDDAEAEDVAPAKGSGSGGDDDALAAAGVPGQTADSLRLGEMMAQAPELARQMTPASHMDRVCALIGGKPQDAGGSALGLCGTGTATLAALAAPAAPEVAGSSTRAAPAAKGPRHESGTRQADAGPAKIAPTAKAPPSGTPGTARAAAEAPSGRVAKGARDDPRLIPPGARYVQVGAFRDPGRAERMARDLLARGLPVARSRPAGGEAQIIMVGPLEGREAIVRMIHRLRRAGYTELIARR